MKNALNLNSFSNQKQLNFQILVLLSSVTILYLLTFLAETYISFHQKLLSIVFPLMYLAFLAAVYKYLILLARYLYPISCALIMTYICYIQSGSIDNIFIYYSILVMSTLYFDYKALIFSTIGITIINILAFVLDRKTFYPNINLNQFVGILISFIFVGIFLSFIIQRIVMLVEKTKQEEARAKQEEARAKQEELRAKKAVIHLEKTLNTLDKTYNELRQAQSQLVQHEKMASLGVLVAGVAHEINNPIGAINSNTSLYKVMISKLQSSDLISQSQDLEQIISKLETVNHTNEIACERIMEIVKSLRSFARLDEAEYKQADIHEGIDSTLILLKHKLKNKVEVIKEYGEIPVVQCYPNQLNQVFMNILSNAIDAIPDAGVIWVKTLLEGENILVIIKDNGIGIKPEHVEKIFDPGFTTKGVGIGTGLGLSIVYRIIEKHKGSISVQSEPGKGTVFTIQLPVNPH